jgi:hypothetical protein
MGEIFSNTFIVPNADWNWQRVVPAEMEIPFMMELLNVLVIKADESKKPDQNILGPEEITLLLIGLLGENVKAAVKALKSNLAKPKQINWDYIGGEVVMFSFFSADYWLSQLVHPEEKSQALSTAMYAHMSDSEEFKERLTVYAQIVNSRVSDNIKYMRFGDKLAEYCGQSERPYFWILTPELFTQAMTCVSIVLKAQRNEL